MAEGLTSSHCREMGVEKISSFRPIYYLGCKNSFIAAIKDAIDEVDPHGGHICDLFSGSGIVGASLSALRQVTSVDIQEYSRVLSSALISPFPFEAKHCREIADRLACNIDNSPVRRHLLPLILYENACIKAAIDGAFDGLVELLEAPPIGSESQNDSNSGSPLGALRAELMENLKRDGLWNSPETMALRYFGGIYFSYEQASVLDAILDVVASSSQSQQDTLKAAVLSTASILVNTVGKQFAQPIRPRNKDGSAKPGIIKIIQRDRTLSALEVFKDWLARYGNLPRGSYPSAALREDYAEALKKYGKEFSVIYADPPYTRDHYSRFYHVLETLSLRDNPTVSKVLKKGKLEWSRGYYREERHQSPFCIRSTAPAAFDSLFRLARESDAGLVLSYSPHEAGDGTHPRVVSTSQITELANLHYRNVIVSRVDGITHNLLNRSDMKLRSRAYAEIIIKCFR